MAQGLDRIPLRIPQVWDPAWFEQLIKDVLAKADIRNAVAGPGITIDGQPDEPATLSAEGDVMQLLEQNYVLATTSAFLQNERILAGEPNVTEIVDEGPGGEIIVKVKNNGIGPQKFRQSVALSVVGRPQNSIGNVNDIAASANDTLLTRVANRLAFTQLTLAMAADALWTYAKIQEATANSVLGRAGGTNGVLADIALIAGQFLVNRSGTLQGDTLQDGDIPAGIARDAEVAAAITAHEGAGNPHPVYLTQAEGDVAYQPINAALGFIFRGTGSPEGAVTADIGSLYLRADGGAGSSLYVKESGSGNTGWQAK